MYHLLLSRPVEVGNYDKTFIWTHNNKLALDSLCVYVYLLLDYAQRLIYYLLLD